MRLRSDVKAITAAFPDPWLRLYSLKANGLPGLVSEVARLGFGISAVSRGELDLALKAGVPADRMALEGIGKTDADFRLRRRVSSHCWVSLESSEDAAALAGRCIAHRRKGDDKTCSCA